MVKERQPWHLIWQYPWLLKKKRILLIDANLRKANLHVWFEQKQENGFVDFLKGEISLGEIIKETSFNNIKLITAGKVSQKGDYLDILSNITRGTQKELEKRLQKAVNAMDFEQAAAIRDLLNK